MQNSSKKKFKILAIELEPTPYKTDLWNAVAQYTDTDVQVIYVERKNWDLDGGHNYQTFPKRRYGNIIYQGKGLINKFLSSSHIVKMIFTLKTDLVYISGYVHLQTILAILASVIFFKRFVVHADVFNTGFPSGRFKYAKFLFRELIRRLIFLRSEAILVCGNLGVETAIRARAPEKKVISFPYSVSISRILSDEPHKYPEECLSDLNDKKKIIFFSGRLIARKGLEDLLYAISELSLNKTWVLWVEGDGPLAQDIHYKIKKLNICERVRILGFCQYDLHSWLLRSSDIVVVPSLEDSWGIVVDEALQLGKAVISSDCTGSGYHLIANGENGYLFKAGDSLCLRDKLEKLLLDSKLEYKLGIAARNCTNYPTPQFNANKLSRLAQGRLVEGG